MTTTSVNQYLYSNNLARANEIAEAAAARARDAVLLRYEKLIDAVAFAEVALHDASDAVRASAEDSHKDFDAVYAAYNTAYRDLRHKQRKLTAFVASKEED